jgi:hypothetical protein
MTVYVVVWVVLMILAVVGGGIGFRGPNNPNYLYGSYFILWACILILGLILFGAVPGGSFQSGAYYPR